MLSLYIQEFFVLVKLIFPLYLIELLFTLIYQTSNIFAGYLPQKNSEILAAVSLTESIVIFIGHYVFFNITSALYTLASQANGAQEDKYLGLLLQRSFCISLFLSIPIIIVWLNTDNILIIFNQNINIIQLASKYMSMTYVIIPAFIVTFSLQNLIEMMDVLYPLVVIYLLGNVVAVLVGYITCFVLDWGIYAIPIILTSAFYTIAIALVIYCRYFSNIFKKIWPGWKLACFTKWDTYFYYGIPILLTEWGLNVQVYMSAFVIGINSENTSIELSVNSIMISLDMVIYALFTSISVAACVRIGNLIGEGRTELVKVSVIILCIITVILSLLQAVLLYLSRNVIGRVFTNNTEVINGVSDVVLLLSILLPLDASFGLIQGVFRGMGKQYFGILLTISDMIVALPVSIVLTVVYEMGVWGYWFGIACGILSSIIFSVVFLFSCRHMFSNLSRVDTPFDNNEVTRLLNDGSESIENNLVVGNQSRFFCSSSRIPYCIILVSMTLLVILGLQIFCKFFDRKFVIHLNESYFKSPIDFCCIQFKP